MSKQRLSVSVETDLIGAGHRAVAKGWAESMSAWVNEALRLKADDDRRMEALDEFIAVYESSHGEITEGDMVGAARRARERARRGPGRAST